MKIRILYLFFCFFGLLTLASCGCPFAHGIQDKNDSEDWEGQIPEANDLSDPLVRANDAFHAIYSKSQELMQPSSLIFQEGDYLVSKGMDYMNS